MMRDRSRMADSIDRKKNPNAAALGRLGGLKGGPARARKLTAAERHASAQQAALARWRGRDDGSDKAGRR